MICALTAVLLLSITALAQENATDDTAAIRATALNYIEGWYEGDATRMESALHPELAKRMISTDLKTGHSQFNHMGAMALVQGHAAWRRQQDAQGPAVERDHDSPLQSSESIVLITAILRVIEIVENLCELTISFTG